MRDWHLRQRGRCVARGDRVGICGSGIALPNIGRERYRTLCHRKATGGTVMPQSAPFAGRDSGQYCSLLKNLDEANDSGIDGHKERFAADRLVTMDIAFALRGLIMTASARPRAEAVSCVPVWLARTAFRSEETVLKAFSSEGGTGSH